MTVTTESPVLATITNRDGVAVPIIQGQEYRLLAHAATVEHWPNAGRGVYWDHSRVTTVRISEQGGLVFRRADARRPRGLVTDNVSATAVDYDGPSGTQWIDPRWLAPLMPVSLAPAWWDESLTGGEITRTFGDRTYTVRRGQTVVAVEPPTFSGAYDPWPDSGFHTYTPRSHRVVGAFFRVVDPEMGGSPNIRCQPLAEDGTMIGSPDAWIDMRHVSGVYPGTGAITNVAPSLDTIAAAWRFHTDSVGIPCTSGMLYNPGSLSGRPRKFEHTCQVLMWLTEHTTRLDGNAREIGRRFWRQVWHTRNTRQTAEWTVARYNDHVACEAVGQFVLDNIALFRGGPAVTVQTLNTVDYGPLFAAFREWSTRERLNYVGGEMCRAGRALSGERWPSIEAGLVRIADDYRAGRLAPNSYQEAGRILWSYIQSDGQGGWIRDYRDDAVVHEQWGQWLANQRDLITTLPMTTTTVGAVDGFSRDGVITKVGVEWIKADLVGDDWRGITRRIERGAEAAGHGRHWGLAETRMGESPNVLLRLDGATIPAWEVAEIDGVRVYPKAKVDAEFGVFRNICNTIANEGNLCGEYDSVIRNADQRSAYFKMGERPVRRYVYVTETYEVERFVAVTNSTSEDDALAQARNDRWITRALNQPDNPENGTGGITDRGFTRFRRTGEPALRANR